MSEITGPVSEINYNGVAVPLSASGGEKLYRHIFSVWGINYFELITSSNDIITPDVLAKYLYDNGYNQSGKYSIMKWIYHQKLDANTLKKNMGLYSEDGVNVYQSSVTIDISTLAINTQGAVFSGLMSNMVDTVSEV